jgi:hypothetical protein
MGSGMKQTEEAKFDFYQLIENTAKYKGPAVVLTQVPYVWSAGQKNHLNLSLSQVILDNWNHGGKSLKILNPLNGMSGALFSVLVKDLTKYGAALYAERPITRIKI